MCKLHIDFFNISIPDLCLEIQRMFAAFGVVLATAIAGDNAQFRGGVKCAPNSGILQLDSTIVSSKKERKQMTDMLDAVISACSEGRTTRTIGSVLRIYIYNALGLPQLPYT